MLIARATRAEGIQNASVEGEIPTTPIKHEMGIHISRGEIMSGPFLVDNGFVYEPTE